MGRTRPAEQEEAAQISALLAQDRWGEAITLFLASMGTPPEITDHPSHDPALLANAPTILYDPFDAVAQKGTAVPASSTADCCRWHSTRSLWITREAIRMRSRVASLE